MEREVAIQILDARQDETRDAPSGGLARFLTDWTTDPIAWGVQLDGSIVLLFADRRLVFLTATDGGVEAKSVQVPEDVEITFKEGQVEKASSGISGRVHHWTFGIDHGGEDDLSVRGWFGNEADQREKFARALASECGWVFAA